MAEHSFAPLASPFNRSHVVDAEEDLSLAATLDCYSQSVETTLW